MPNKTNVSSLAVHECGHFAVADLAGLLKDPPLGANQVWNGNPLPLVSIVTQPGIDAQGVCILPKNLLRIFVSCDCKGIDLATKFKGAVAPRVIERYQQNREKWLRGFLAFTVAGVCASNTLCGESKPLGGTDKDHAWLYALTLSNGVAADALQVVEEAMTSVNQLMAGPVGEATLLLAEELQLKGTLSGDVLRALWADLSPTKAKAHYPSEPFNVNALPWGVPKN